MNRSKQSLITPVTEVTTMVKKTIFKFLNIRNRSPQEDIELGRPEEDLRPRVPFINGFPSAAAFIASDPDNSFFVYKSFNRLSARNILYLESELFELQEQQDNTDAEDFRGNPDTLQCFRSWRRFRPSTDPRQLEKIELIKVIRRTLKEYRKKLQSHSALEKLADGYITLQTELWHYKKQFAR